MAASGIEAAFRILEGRWKMMIIFHLFDRSVLRFSELERDGVVSRLVYPQVPPKVEYRLTEWGQAMCPALDALLEWAAARPASVEPG